jgi:hypothetical protein
MPTIPHRVASAFVVLRGRYGEVTRMAEDRGRSRQSLYREAEAVVGAVDGAAAQDQVEELRPRGIPIGRLLDLPLVRLLAVFGDSWAAT